MDTIANRAAEVRVKRQQTARCGTSLVSPCHTNPLYEDPLPSLPRGLDLSLWVKALQAHPAGMFGTADVLAWVEGPLRRFFSFEHLIIGYSELVAERLEMKRRLTVGYDLSRVMQFDSTKDFKERNCVTWWLRKRRPLVIDPDAPPPFACPKEIDRIRHFGLGWIAIHAVIDPIAKAGTYIAFSGLSTAAARSSEALEVMAPVLHSLNLATLEQPAPKDGLAALSPRQREIASQAIAGRDDKTIAAALGISEHTVGNHLRAIYARLGVRKRSQLLMLR